MVHCHKSWCWQSSGSSSCAALQSGADLQCHNPIILGFKKVMNLINSFWITWVHCSHLTTLLKPSFTRTELFSIILPLAADHVLPASYCLASFYMHLELKLRTPFHISKLWFLLSRVRYKRSSLSVLSKLTTWKHHTGSTFHLSQISYMPSVPSEISDLNVVLRKQRQLSGFSVLRPLRLPSLPGSKRWILTQKPICQQKSSWIHCIASY